MAKTISYGMVGGSLHAFIGEVHRKALNFDTRVELVAGCFSSNAQRNAETAEVYCIPGERVYANYTEMAKAEAARDDGIDFVSIVTPNVTHYEIAREFLNQGIHVVCEKPLCFEIWQAQELVKLAKEKELLFAVTYTHTGYTMSRVIKEMIAEGKIGNIIAVNAEYAQDWLLGELSSADSGGDRNLSIWRTDPSKSGISNCVGDIGTHIENYVHYVTGLKIKRLLATTNSYGNTLDLNANIIVEYDTGVNGAYWCSQIAAGKLNGLVVRIYGDKGSLEWEQHYPDYVRYTPKDGAPQSLSRGTGYIRQQAAGYSRLPSGHPEGLVIGFANIYRDFITELINVRAGKPCAQVMYPTVEDGLSGVKFIHAVMESAKNGARWVELDSLK